MITIDVLFVLTLAAAVLAIVDAIVRVRARSGQTALAVIELIAGLLLLVTLFPSLAAYVPVPLSRGVLALVLAVVAAVMLLARRRGGSRSVTIITLVLNLVVALFAFGWLRIPGVIG
ncbi:hypothetical protein [Desertivibrio insolitus]|uniref:hypothetical protein n=1 Tax=Herbiconiux sp. SYSU D00978 TaxID=2812562 RepID=UPI001A9621CE|nr:hypothetical protein [Herbiconiux sp. SYSU D00978]